MTCPNCGKRILDKEAQYCPYCRKELRATPIVEQNVEQKNYWICQNCKQINRPEAENCKNCGRAISFTKNWETNRISMTHYESPSLAWYILPLFFGIVGGLIGYVGTKDRDKDTAATILVVGVGITIIGAVVIWTEYAWLMSHIF